MAKIEIVINTHPGSRRDEELHRCLSAIYSQDFKDFEILLVENYNNFTEIDRFFSEYPNLKAKLKMILDGKKHLSYLFNVGWKNTSSDLLAYIADDVEIDAGWLRNVMKELEDPNVGIITGPIVSKCFPTGEMHRLYILSQKNLLGKILTWPYLHFAMDDKVLSPGNLFESGAYSIGSALAESRDYPRQSIDLATTSSMGLKREVLEKLGGFDEDFRFNHADGDLFIRAKKAGYKVVFSPEISAVHNLRMGPSRNAYIIGKDTVLFYKKHIRPKTLHGALGVLLNLLALNSYWVVVFLTSGNISYLGGIYGFIEGIFKK